METQQPDRRRETAVSASSHRVRRAAQEEVYPDDDLPDLGYGKIDLKQPTETKAERDYFDEFFGKK